MSSTNRLPDTGSTTHRRWRDIALLAGLFGFVIAGLAGLALATGWEDTIAQLSRLTFLQFVVLLGLSLMNYVFRGSRWHVMARKIGLPTTLAQDLRHFIGGFAMSVTPGRVGELIRMRWIKRETGWAVERTAPLVLMDRAGDLAAMAIILALGLSFGAGGIAFGLPVAIAALLVAFIATRPSLLAGAAGFAYRLTGFFPRLMVRVRRAAGSLSAFSDPKTVIITLALGLTGWIAEGYACHLLLMWMG